MTSNQIAYAKVVEDKRHNLATEAENMRHNVRSEKISKQQNKINKEHYERSDTSGLINAQASLTSANANAMNAVTNRYNYQLQHDIEYSLDKMYPDEDPAELERLGKIPISAAVKWTQGNLTRQQTATELEKTRKTGYEARTAQIESEYAEKKNQSQILNNYAGAGSSVLNSVFGKGGIVNAVSGLYEATNK